MDNTGFIQMLEFFTRESWVVHAFIVVFGALIIDALQNRVLSRLHVELKKTGNYWDDAFVDALRAPLRAIIWLVGLYYALAIADFPRSQTLVNALAPLRDLAVISVLTWFAVRLISRYEQSFQEQRRLLGQPVDPTTADAVAKLLRAAIVITALLVALQTLGYSISGVLAFGGVGGIAVGFAAKDLLANFFGGLMVYLDRPFSVGDWVRSPDRGIEGTVEQIGWRLSVIRTFDKRPLYIPNSLFTQIIVENPSRMSNRRIYETIGLRYSDAGRLEAVINDVRTMLQAHEEIDTSQTLIVNFNKFAPSSLGFFIYAFTRTTQWVRYHEVKQDVMLKLIKIIESHGAECAFPTSTVHLSDGPGAGQEAGRASAL